jgi:flagellar hook-basal body complex protein FliE
MKIQPINDLLPEILSPKSTEKPGNSKFENILSDFIGSVNKTQNDADSITKSFVMGDDVEIHDVMIAGEKAKTSLELLMEIRNKTIDMYKELIRMQP